MRLVSVSLLFLFGTSGYMLAAFTNGLAVDKLGIRGALIFSMLSFLVGAGLLSLGLPFVASLVGDLLLAFGIGIIDAGFNSYIAALSQKNTTALLNYRHFWGSALPTLETRVVPVDDVRAALPRDTPVVDAKARAAQVVARRRHLAWRFRT